MYLYSQQKQLGESKLHERTSPDQLRTIIVPGKHNISMR